MINEKPFQLTEDIINSCVPFGLAVSNTGVHCELTIKKELEEIWLSSLVPIKAMRIREDIRVTGGSHKDYPPQDIPAELSISCKPMGINLNDIYSGTHSAQKNKATAATLTATGLSLFTQPPIAPIETDELSQVNLTKPQ